MIIANYDAEGSDVESVRKWTHCFIQKVAITSIHDSLWMSQTSYSPWSITKSTNEPSVKQAWSEYQRKPRRPSTNLSACKTFHTSWHKNCTVHKCIPTQVRSQADGLQSTSRHTTQFWAIRSCSTAELTTTTCLDTVECTFCFIVHMCIVSYSAKLRKPVRRTTWSLHFVSLGDGKPTKIKNAPQPLRSRDLRVHGMASYQHRPSPFRPLCSRSRSNLSSSQSQHALRLTCRKVGTSQCHWIDGHSSLDQSFTRQLLMLWVSEAVRRLDQVIFGGGNPADEPHNIRSNQKTKTRPEQREGWTFQALEQDLVKHSTSVVRPSARC